MDEQITAAMVILGLNAIASESTKMDLEKSSAMDSISKKNSLVMS
jgi:hypothetical protein